MLIWDCVNFLKNYKNFLHFMLDKRTILLYSNTGVEKHNAAVAQSVERRIGSAEVTGPIPVSSFLVKKRRTLKIKVFRFFRYLKESGTIWYASLANSQSDVL